MARGTSIVTSFPVLALVASLAAPVTMTGCDDEPAPAWSVVHQELDEAILFLWGSSSTDVWAVGGDAGEGKGPLVMHFDGSDWTRKRTGTSGDLWAVFGFAGGPIYMGGKNGQILRYQDGAFQTMTTPGTATVFGIWGASPDDVWAVGGAEGGASGAFAWRLQGDAWVDAPGFPADLVAQNAMWKIFGRSASDVWLVGTNGVTLRYDGTQFESLDSGIERALFTVHGNSERMVAVGGFGTGVILEHDGTGWQDVTPAGSPGTIGVFMTPDEGYAVGADGAVWHRDQSGWKLENTKLPIFDSYHAVWVDPDGGVWAAGGQVQAFPLVRGVLVHKGTTEIPTSITEE